MNGHGKLSKYEHIGVHSKTAHRKRIWINILFDDKKHVRRYSARIQLMHYAKHSPPDLDTYRIFPRVGICWESRIGWSDSLVAPCGKIHENP